MGPQQYLFQKGWRIDAPCQFENKMEWKTKYHAEGYIPCICIERTVFNFSLNGLHLAPSLLFHILHSLYILEKRIFLTMEKAYYVVFWGHVTQDGLELTTYTKLASNSEESTCLSLPCVCGGVELKVFTTAPDQAMVWNFFFFPLRCFVSYKSNVCTSR